MTKVFLTGAKKKKKALTIGAALFLIVLFSVSIGAALPIVFHFGLRVDPAHAGSSVQVVMDVLGVTITCVLANIVLLSSQ